MRTQPVPAAWAVEIDLWTTAMHARRLSTQTIALRTYHLKRLARGHTDSSPWELDVADLLSWLGGHEWGRETSRAVRSSLRAFWSWGLTVGRTAVNIAEVVPAVRPEAPRPRPAAPNVVYSAVRASEPRVVLMLRLANELGMRRGEVAQVHPRRDLQSDQSGWSLIVHGKGSKKRVLPLPEDLAQELLVAPDGYLFPSPQGGHLSPHWVGALVSRALGDGTTMHQLRHLCATEIHEQTRDVRLVQTVLGHASLATTQRYLAVDSARMRDAIMLRSAGAFV